MKKELMGQLIHFVMNYLKLGSLWQKKKLCVIFPILEQMYFFIANVENKVAKIFDPVINLFLSLNLYAQ